MSLTQNLTVQDILALPSPAADHRIAYGEGELQFADLRLPEGDGPHPVVVVIHGGCWRAQYDLSHIASFGQELTRAGVATWSLEYRRIGNDGGGWPGTFHDVAHGIDHLRQIAGRFRLDLDRVVAVGHSAGGHLALWAAARHRLPEASPLHTPSPLSLKGAVSLAGVTDLRQAEAREVCGTAVRDLTGGTPAEVPDHYRDGSPLELLPLGVPQRLVHGARDEIVPLDLGEQYVKLAAEKGDDVRLVVREEAAHFELIAPATPAWQAVKQEVLSLLNR